jgi:hypothetical protein
MGGYERPVVCAANTLRAAFDATAKPVAGGKLLAETDGARHACQPRIGSGEARHLVDEFGLQGQRASRRLDWLGGVAGADAAFE